MPAPKDLKVTISTLRKDPMAILRGARGRTVAVTRNGKVAAYFLSARAYDRLMDKMEDLEDVITVYERMGEPGIPTTIDELMERYGSEGEGEK